MNAPRILLALVAASVASFASAADANRLTYLDTNDPYYPSRAFPRLVTPQWVGEPGVEAVVILSIDDMRGHERWEKFLRPILQRLQRIDGRAPVSIMTCTIDPKHPHLQKWLAEGLSLETHTIDHPCPLLGGGNFERAKSTYDRCVDLLSAVPRSRPVAFRMPCCDSLNTLSPRFYAEVFNRTTARGNFLTLNSSVFNLTTPDDPDLPRDIVFEPDGRDRFRKYVPTSRSFATYIKDYPYPFVVNRLCWEMPCATPSDWQAQFLHGPNNPATVRDWKLAIDATVRKQGTFTLVFHPHGWIRAEQVVDLIDHAVAKHGKKVKFLTLREAQERLNKHLLAGQPLRAPDGRDNGVRLLDVDNDGYLDVVIGNDKVRQTRIWQPKTKTWAVKGFPVKIVSKGKDAGVRFGVLRPDGKASFLVRNENVAGGWHFDGAGWVEDKALLTGLEVGGQPVFSSQGGMDRGVRLRDLDNDGRCELIVGNERTQAVFGWSPGKKRWDKAPFSLPPGTALVDARGRDRGLRFIDIDEDGHADVLFSNEDRYSLHLFTSMTKGWSRRVMSGKRGDRGALPMVARNGTDNGAWFHSRHLWVQNEHTAGLRDLVERRSFNEMLANVDPSPKSPQASLRALKAAPGFAVELVAAEPLVQSPIAFAWGPDGKLWVVEMGDYPLGVDGKGKAGGRVKYLESTKGDGKYDRATVFLDNLAFPTGVAPWRNGVLITCAPDILYAEDTDGRGKASRVTKLYSGFVQGNQQHRVNTLAWGLDNWVHVANGDSGGVVRALKTGRRVSIRGRDLRIRPDDGALDAETGQTQYGRSRDDWGNWFGGNNSNPMWHFVLADRYLRRNPHLAPPELRVTVPSVPGAAPVFPRSRTLARFNDPGAANRFTSACSPIVYRDELFGPANAFNTFVSEPVHNLVHRAVMRAAGATFTSQRAPDERNSEFLASTDNWFRPTMIQTGPDGALYVADMYRAVIEHPEWIPRDWQRKLDLRAGHDRGRIYRVYPVGKKLRPVPRLDKLDTAGLVAALDSPNGWQRDLAHMMLLWRADKRAVPLLMKLASTSLRPQARLHALCALDGMKALPPALLASRLDDVHPGVRRHAVRLCEGRFDDKRVTEALVQRIGDPDVQVRLQLACTLGEWDDALAGKALGQLLVRSKGDRYLTAAALSSVHAKNLDAVLLAVLAGSKGEAPAVLTELLRLASALGQARATVTLLGAVSMPSAGKYAAWQFTALASLLDGLQQRGSSLEKLHREGGKDVQAALTRAEGLFKAALALVKDDKAALPERMGAVRLLGRGLSGRKEDMALLGGLLVPQTADELQAAAVTALGRLSEPGVGALLLRGWKGHAPGLRSRVLDVLLERDARLRELLGAIESKRVPAQEVDTVRRQRLLGHKDKTVRVWAEKVFAGAVDADRQKVIDAYRPALALKGDPEKGKRVFAKSCAACHRLAGVGNDVGPDLAPLAERSGEYLLIAILDPNRAVEARYISYQAELKDGRSLVGVLAAETGASITLIAADGKRFVVPRANLDTLTSTGKSAMPEGLERDAKQQDIADLLAYLRAARSVAKPKTFPGNKPERVKAGADGALRLLASNAAIYGRTLVLEKKHGNLGWWSSADDRAVWEVEVPRAGKYSVTFHYACDRSAAGNTFVLVTDGGKLTGTVASTGSWDKYWYGRMGVVALRAGRQHITLRSAGEVRGALIDLREIRLVAEK